MKWFVIVTTGLNALGVVVQKEALGRLISLGLVAWGGYELVINYWS